jgi:hypothetical protein
MSSASAPRVEAKPLYEVLKDGMKTPIAVLIESIRIFPDSLVLGVALLSIISLNRAYALLLLAMMEVMGVQRILASFLGGIAPIAGGSGAFSSICQPGFSFPNTMRISLLETLGKPSAFPSPVMFFIAAITTYMVASLQEFEKELNTLGADLSARTQAALFLSGILILAVFMMRLTYGCETFGSVFMSLLVGLLAGYGSFAFHRSVFGREGVNVLSLPLIRTMDERGKPLYVCAPS